MTIKIQCNAQQKVLITNTKNNVVTLKSQVTLRYAALLVAVLLFLSIISSRKILSDERTIVIPLVTILIPFCCCSIHEFFNVCHTIFSLIIERRRGGRSRWRRRRGKKRGSSVVEPGLLEWMMRWLLWRHTESFISILQLLFKMIPVAVVVVVVESGGDGLGVESGVLS